MSNFSKGGKRIEEILSAPWRTEAIAAAAPNCKWAAGHNGLTCIQTECASAYWCLACKREWNRRAG